MKFEREIGEVYRLKVPFMSVYTSVFLVKTEKANILVDAATTVADVEECIIPALSEMGLQLSDIKYLCLTHNHEDHSGGKNRIVELHSNVIVIGHKQTLDLKDIELYTMQGHTLDCIGLLDKRTGTLISGDGLQGAGIGRFRCSLADKNEYLKTIEKIKNDPRVQNVLFSHAYEPWYSENAFGREEVEKRLQDCLQYV